MRGKQQAVLATAELADYRPLDSFAPGRGSNLIRGEKRSLIAAVAGTIRKLHENGFRHGHLHPHHIFVKFDASGSVDARLIDLEKTKRRPFISAPLDFNSLSRGCYEWTRTDRLRFLLAYYRTTRVSCKLKLVWRLVERIGRNKRRGPKPLDGKR